jgi:hypothetical protein
MNSSVAQLRPRRVVPLRASALASERLDSTQAYYALDGTTK